MDRLYSDLLPFINLIIHCKHSNCDSRQSHLSWQSKILLVYCIDDTSYKLSTLKSFIFTLLYMIKCYTCIHIYTETSFDTVYIIELVHGADMAFSRQNYVNSSQCRSSYAYSKKPQIGTSDTRQEPLKKTIIPLITCVLDLTYTIIAWTVRHRKTRCYMYLQLTAP